MTTSPTTIPTTCDECAGPVNSNGRGCECDMAELRFLQANINLALVLGTDPEVWRDRISGLKEALGHIG